MVIFLPKYVVDSDGVVLEEILDSETVIKINRGDRVLRKKQMDYMVGSVDLKKRFIKVDDRAVFFLSKYGKHICLLLKFVGFLDGILKFNNGIFLTNRSIAKIFKINERNAVKILNELIKEDIIHKHKLKNRNYYTFNPWIASRGKRINKELYEEFKMTEWASNSQNPEDYETEIEEEYGN